MHSLQPVAGVYRKKSDSKGAPYGAAAVRPSMPFGHSKKKRNQFFRSAPNDTAAVATDFAVGFLRGWTRYSESGFAAESRDGEPKLAPNLRVRWILGRGFDLQAKSQSVSPAARFKLLQLHCCRRRRRMQRFCAKNSAWPACSANDRKKSSRRSVGWKKEKIFQSLQFLALKSRSRRVLYFLTI